MYITLKDEQNKDYEDIKVLDYYLECLAEQKLLWQKLNAPRDLFFMSFKNDIDLNLIKAQIKAIQPKNMPMIFSRVTKSGNSEMNIQKDIISFFRNHIQRHYQDATLYVDVMKSLAGGKEQARLVSIAKHYGLERHNPDIVIVCALQGYAGIAIELKKETPFKKDGTLKSNKVVRKNSKGLIVETYDHNEEQASKLIALRQNNFYATYAIDYKNTIDILCKYFDIRTN